MDGFLIQKIRGWKTPRLILPKAELLNMIRPNRINLPSPRPQWSLFSFSLIHIIATGSAVRADLFYWDGLHEKVLFDSIFHSHGIF